MSNLAAALALIACSSGIAEAQEPHRVRIEIPAGTLNDALARLSREAGISIGTPGSLPQRRTPAIHGTMSIAEALARLLEGSGYIARQVGQNAWRIEPLPSASRPVTSERTEETASSSPPPGPPIVVTGSKRNTRLLDLPMAVAVIGSGDLAHRGADSGTASIASEIEGLSMTALGPGRNRLFLRGVADSAFNGESQSTVAVTLDDARLTYAAPDPDIALVDLERVEVLKGPQGLLYGTGAIGGVYHLVSRRAELDHTALTVEAGGEMVAGGGLGYSGSAVANFVLAPGKAGLRLVGYSRLAPGWIDTGSARDTNSSATLGARMGLGIDPGGGWRLDLTGFAQWLESRDSQYVYDRGARSRPAQIAEPHDNDLRHLSARVSRETGGLTLTVSSGMTWHEVNDAFDATIGAGSFGLADPISLEDRRTYRLWDTEARISGEQGSVRWLFGASHVQARQHAMTLLFGSADQLLVDDDRRTTDDTAAYGDFTVPLGTSVKLDVGGRVFRSSVTETRIFANGSQTREFTDSGLTPGFALSWRPDERQLLFLRYGSALRQGGLDISSTGDVETLKGDELSTIEGGWREQLADGGSLQLGSYWTWWDNLQSDLLQPNGLVETRNAGRAEIVGVEASGKIPLNSDWEISGGVAWQDARLVRNDLGVELDDRRLPVVPDYVLRGAVKRQFEAGSANGWLRFKLRYIGPSRLSFDPRLDRPMGNVLESELEAHLIINRFEASIRVANLFGRTANEFAFGNPLRLLSSQQYTPQAPLSASFTIKAAL